MHLIALYIQYIINPLIKLFLGVGVRVYAGILVVNLAQGLSICKLDLWSLPSDNIVVVNKCGGLAPDDIFLTLLMDFNLAVLYHTYMDMEK